MSEDLAVPFKLHRGFLVIVKCSIGELPDLSCIVDTGVTETVVDPSVVHRLSLETRPDHAVFLTQEATVDAVSLPFLKLGPIRTGSLAGIVTDLSSLMAKFGIRPDVLIGMDVLRRTNFVIDYKARQLSFSAVPPLVHSTSLVHDLRFALVESTIMGKRVLLQVDTGFPGLLLYGGWRGQPALAVKWENQVQSVAHTLVAASLPSEVRIGNWHTQRLELAVISGPPDLFGFDGLIGPQALNAHRIAFDFENNLLSWD